MKCQIKPKIFLMPSLWYHILFCLFSAGGGGGRWVGRKVPGHVASYREPHPSRASQRPVCAKEWRCSGFWSQSLSKEGML